MTSGKAIVHTPQGDAIESILDSEEHLERNFERYEQFQQAINRFVADQLVEATYNKDNYPERLNDYYSLPGMTKKALTKKGAEKVTRRFRFHAGPLELVSQEVTKEHVHVIVSALLLDHAGRVVGSAMSGCSTAEKSFQSRGAQMKYGARFNRGNDQPVVAADFRAAINDVTARARKRAFVQAVIVACAMDEIFEVAQQDEGAVRSETVEELPTTTPDGKVLKDLSDTHLRKILAWAQKADKADYVEAVSLILDGRRDPQDAFPEDDDEYTTR